MHAPPLRLLSAMLFMPVPDEDDAHPDRFYQMNRQMTVFGFGRQRGDKHLATVPRLFPIGLLETTDHAAIGRMLERLLHAR